METAVVGVDDGGDDAGTVVADVAFGAGAELTPLTRAKMRPPSPASATTSRITAVPLQRRRCLLEGGRTSSASIGTSTHAE